MLTHEIEKFLKDRDYVIKKASEILKIIDVNISTQIKNVTFKPESNDYYIRTVDIKDGKPEERIFKFHVYTIEEYHNECRMLGIVPEDLEETKPVIEQQEVIPFKQPTEIIPFEKPKTGVVAQFNNQKNNIDKRARQFKNLQLLKNYLDEVSKQDKNKVFTLTHNTKAN